MVVSRLGMMSIGLGALLFTFQSVVIAPVRAAWAAA